MFTPASNKNVTKVSGFLLLLGALVFSLSSIPGHDGSNASAEMSSNTCDYANGLHRSKDGVACKATQTVDGKIVNGNVQVKVVSDSYVDAISNKQVNTQYIEIDGDLETECKTGCEDGKRTTSFSLQKQMSDLSNINKIVAQEVESSAKSLAKDETDAEKNADKVAKEKAEKKDKLDKCTEDSKGHKITAVADTFKCFNGRLDNLDEDQQAEYFEKYIQPKLATLADCGDKVSLSPLLRNQRQPMMNSTSMTCLNNQRLVEQYIGTLKADGIGGDYVSNSLDVFLQYEGYKAQARQLQQQMQAMGNSPLRNQLMNQMRSEQYAADWDYYNRSQALSGQDWSDWGWDAGGYLGKNYQSYRAGVDGLFSGMGMGNIYNNQFGNGLPPNGNGTAMTGSHPQSLPLPGPGQQNMAYQSPFLSNAPTNYAGYQPQVMQPIMRQGH